MEKVLWLQRLSPAPAKSAGAATLCSIPSVLCSCHSVNGCTDTHPLF